jgi:hypothetical protein
VDRRFVREHVAYLFREAVLLCFFLAAVADKHGLSFYSDGTLVIQLRITLSTLVQAKDELIPQPIMPLDLPVKVRSWELTVYPRSHIRRWLGMTRPAKARM